MKNKIAIITGITGQDGAYLSQLLLNKNYQVIGLVRPNDDYSKLNYLKIKEQIIFEELDLLNLNDIKKILKKYKPSEIYNFAAQSSVKYSLKDPLGTISFNIISVINLLESINEINKNIRFFQASSCEIFGNNQNLPVTEETILDPQNFYATSKASSHFLIKNYREIFGLFVCSGILFNHESYLRGADFFVKKVIRESIEIKNNKRDFLFVGNLDIKRDIGYAPDYIEAMWLMLQAEKAEDYIISSGESIYLKDIVFYIFNKLNIDKNKIKIDQDLLRSFDIKETLGDNSKIKKELGWNYSRSFFDVLDLLIEEELRALAS